jgi:hypothetical protein
VTAPTYELVLTPPARRAITDTLLEPVADAVIDFLTTALLDNLADRHGAQEPALCAG